ncbi:MAG: DUF4328 domain-containing protein [Verrucomicrobiae bacterium]|nr:DUF4328 domain-containing protein [Verrucomicrobiae bacterium]
MSKWYYTLNDGKTFGPLEEAQMAELIRGRTIGPETLVYSETMGGWAAANRTRLIVHLAESAPVPQVRSSATRIRPSSLQAKPLNFEDPSKLTLALAIALGCLLIFAAAAALFGAMQIQLLAGSPTPEHIHAADVRQRALAAFEILAFISVWAVFSAWIRRMNWNARQLGARELRFTPDRALAWCLIPICFFWRPYEVMREIWRASRNPAGWLTVRAPLLLGLWWAFLLSGVGLGILSAIARLKLGPSSTAAAFHLGASASLIVASLCGLRIAFQIMRMQMDLHSTQVGAPTARI